MNYVPGEGYEVGDTLFATHIELSPCSNFKNFTIFKVYCKKFNEVDIKNIKIDGTDCGFLIPSFSLLSVDHDYSSNKNFQLFSDAIIKWFLSSLQMETTKSEVPLENFFDENLGFIALSNNSYSNSKNNERKIFFELMNSGIYVDTLQTEPSFYPDNSLFPDKKLPNTKRITFNTTTNKAMLDEFVFEIFHSVVFKESDHFLQFFYLYQVIETLIEFVMSNEYSQVRTKINTLGGSATTQQLKKLVETLNESVQERKRINKLCNDYTGTYTDDFNIQQSLCDFIRGHLNSEFETDSDIGTSIYEVRNKSFHEFRTLRNASKLSSITPHVFDYILHLISSYKY
ncbi:hypothetical protein ACQKE0_18540 [Shewanella colwelliana]|uniref:hypothetical protein n=1 Tax=Shewanella colwelliana TaxID=23 RepID=UPI003D01C644